MFWRSLLVLSIFLVLAHSQECNNQTSCATCTSTTGCGWCAATGNCMIGDESGPTGAFCLGEHSWDFGPGTCRECNTLHSCRFCNEEPDCMWCAVNGGTGGSCVAQGSVCQNPTTICPCHSSPGCFECLESPECTWCGAQRACVEKENIPPELAECEFLDVCTCSDITECYECKNEDGCGYCAVTQTCNSLSSFPIDCLPARSCPLGCIPSGCGDRECGPFNGCLGSCGFCAKNQFCTADGVCKRLPSAAGHFIGGLIFGLGVVGLAFGGYVFYKKKTASSYGGLA